MYADNTLHLSDTDELRSVRVMHLGKRHMLSIEYSGADLSIAGSPAQIECLQSHIALTPERAKRYARTILGPDATDVSVQLAASLLLVEKADDAEEERFAHG